MSVYEGKRILGKELKMTDQRLVIEVKKRVFWERLVDHKCQILLRVH